MQVIGDQLFVIGNWNQLDLFAEVHVERDEVSLFFLLAFQEILVDVNCISRQFDIADEFLPVVTISFLIDQQLVITDASLQRIVRRVKVLHVVPKSFQVFGLQLRVMSPIEIVRGAKFLKIEIHHAGIVLEPRKFFLQLSKLFQR